MPAKGHVIFTTGCLPHARLREMFNEQPTPSGANHVNRGPGLSLPHCEERGL